MSILSVSISIIGLIFVGFELYAMRKQREQEKRAIRIQHSIQLAKEFERLISNELSFITNIFDNIQFYSETINRLNDEDLICFDIDEYNELSETYPELLSILNFPFSSVKHQDSSFNEMYNAVAEVYLQSFDISFDEYCLVKSLQQCNWELNDEERNDKKDFSEQEIKKISKKNMMIMYYKRKLLNYYGKMLSTSLNKLEAFAMSINTELADESIIYKSLHQMFLTTVKTLYPFICNSNKNKNADKYYTHIIQLYNRWIKKYAADINEENKNKKEYQEKRNEINKNKTVF